MQGFRTILVAIFGPFVLWGAKVLAARGFSLTPDQEQLLTELLVGGGMSLAMIFMRLITSTPVGKKVVAEFSSASTTTAAASTTIQSQSQGATPTVVKALALLFTAGIVLSALSMSGCATVDKVAKTITSPSAQPYITDAVTVALIATEASGVSAKQINTVAKAVLAADTGVSASLTALSLVAQQQIAKLKLPAADTAIIQVFLSAFDTAVQAKLGTLSGNTATSVAAAQAAVADLLNTVITDTGG